MLSVSTSDPNPLPSQFLENQEFRMSQPATTAVPRTTEPGHAHRGWVLATVCAAVLAINLDTTIVNVALPSISRELSAGTRQLQWVVDGYNLAFAGLVLAVGARR
jgi:hypothetical protein